MNGKGKISVHLTINVAGVGITDKASVSIPFVIQKGNFEIDRGTLESFVRVVKIRETMIGKEGNRIETLEVKAFYRDKNHEKIEVVTELKYPFNGAIDNTLQEAIELMCVKLHEHMPDNPPVLEPIEPIVDNF